MKPNIMLILITLVTTCAFAEPATTVKLRRLELKNIEVTVAGQPKPVIFSYAEVVRQVLLSTGQRGTNADDLIKVIGVWTPIKKDIDAGKKELLLDQPSYDVLLQKINDMSWSPPPDFAVNVADFITYVRGLKEEDFDATPSTAPPEKAK